MPALGLVNGQTLDAADGNRRLAFTRDGILVAASPAAGPSLWDYKSEQKLATFAVAQHDDLSGLQLALSPDGKYLAYDTGIVAGTSSGKESASEVATVWSAPYLDGKVADGVQACANS